jgi:hypothetical protein
VLAESFSPVVFLEDTCDGTHIAIFCYLFGNHVSGVSFRHFLLQSVLPKVWFVSLFVRYVSMPFLLCHGWVNFFLVGIFRALVIVAFDMCVIFVRMYFARALELSSLLLRFCLCW